MSALERYEPPRSLGEIERLASHFYDSGLFGNSPKTQGEIIVKMLAGAENGFPPFASVQGIHVIQGKPEMGADLLARAVKQSGRYDYRVREMSDERVRIEFFDGDESIGESSFSMSDAKRAGISNAMYGKYPRNMLFARAMSNGVAWFCPDATSTRFYTDGEINGQDRSEPETVIHEVTVERGPFPDTGEEVRVTGWVDRAPVQPVEPSLPREPVAGEPEAIVAEQLAAIGADGRKRLKAHMRALDAVQGDQRKPETWINSIIDNWGGQYVWDDNGLPMYTDLARVLEGCEAIQRVDTPLERQQNADARADREAEGLFEEHAPKAQGALTPRMYDANLAGS